jgi:hypothetical protein
MLWPEMSLKKAAETKIKPVKKMKLKNGSNYQRNVDENSIHQMILFKSIHKKS